MSSIAIYSNNTVSRQFINDIKSLFDTTYDICIFTDEIHNTVTYETAVLPSMFMEFHKEILIFLDIDHYLVYKSRLLCNNIYLYIDTSNKLDDSIDRKLLTNFKKIITRTNDNTLIMVSL